LPIGRRPLDIDRVAVLQERARGQSLSEIAETHRISRATVSRLLKQAKEAARRRGSNQVWTTLEGKQHNVVVKKAGAMTPLKNRFFEMADDLNQLYWNN
jgi:transcriptional regulator